MNTSGESPARYDLAGKTALVTGGASGIGLATAIMLARSGCRVAINHLAEDARGPEQVEALRGRGLDALSAPGSVADAAECASMVARAAADLGRLDYLVANAGTPGTRKSIAPQELDRLTEELWREVIEVNLLGVFRCIKAAALFGLSETEERMLNEVPHRGTAMPPTDPLIYRFYEMVMVNGPAWKALIEEEFGDGIMSAIDFDFTFERVAHEKGDRVQIVMSGKFLPYKYYGNEQGMPPYGFKEA